MTSNDPRIVDYNRLIKNVEHLVEAIESSSALDRSVAVAGVAEDERHG